MRQVDEHIWLVTFMHYDLGYFDDETWRLEPIENPVWTESVTYPLHGRSGSKLGDLSGRACLNPA
jgi:hypothetical protein